MRGCKGDGEPVVVARSPILSELISKVEVQRGRFYIFDANEYVMARITPLVGLTFLLEGPWRDGWSKAKSGSWRVVLGAIERDDAGTFHGVGSLASKGKSSSVFHPLKHADIAFFHASAALLAHILPRR